MEKQKKILKTLDKARLGEHVTEKEWDHKRMPSTLKEVAKEFGLMGTCDPDNPVPTVLDLPAEGCGSDHADAQPSRFESISLAPVVTH